eukprot:g80379.t1
MGEGKSYGPGVANRRAIGTHHDTAGESGPPGVTRKSGKGHDTSALGNVEDAPDIPPPVLDPLPTSKVLSTMAAGEDVQISADETVRNHSDGQTG